MLALQQDIDQRQRGTAQQRYSCHDISISTCFYSLKDCCVLEFPLALHRQHPSGRRGVVMFALVSRLVACVVRYGDQYLLNAISVVRTYKSKKSIVHRLRSTQQQLSEEPQWNVYSAPNAFGQPVVTLRLFDECGKTVLGELGA